MINKKGVVLLSGGLDSCVIAAKAKFEGYEVSAIIFDYGQMHEREIGRAIKIAKSLEIPWHVVDLMFAKNLFRSQLLDGTVEDHRPLNEGEIAPTYVPMRNSIFLAIAAGYAESIEADNLFIGANFVDYGNYPDCRKEYLESMRQSLMLGSSRWSEGEHELTVHFHDGLTKSDIVKLGIECNAPMELSWSCYRGQERPCLACDSCYNRTKGFFEAGMSDPALTEDEWREAIKILKV